MRRSRVARALGVAALLLLLLPAAATATVRGGCEAQGTSTSGGELNLTTNAVWHLRSTDTIQLFGQAASPQTAATVRATAFGFAIPLGGGTADPSTEAESGTFQVSNFALLGRVFLISGESTGPGPGCDGEIQVVIDDVNPLLTALGGGALVATLIGLVGLAWAVRRPDSFVRLGTGLVSMGLIGIGISVLLQQISNGSPASLSPGDAALLAPSPFVDSVVSPAGLSLETGALAQRGLLALLILVLLPFPSQLFNSTLEQNYEDIKAAFRRIPLAGRLARPSAESLMQGAPRVWWRRIVVVGFVLIAGVLYTLLDPSLGLDGRSLITYFGLVLGLVLVTWIANLPSRALHNRLVGDKGRVWVIASTLIVAAFCVLISRLIGFLPGYLYGLVFGFAFASRISAQDEGSAGAFGAWWMIAIALVAWLTLGAVRIPGVEDTIPGVIAEAAFAALVVAGVEGVVFALMPLRFLPGELVFKFQRVRWVALYALGLAGFVFILLNPANGYLPADNTVSFVIAVALFVGFGIASIVFWGYFRFRRNPRAA